MSEQRLAPSQTIYTKHHAFTVTAEHSAGDDWTKQTKESWEAMKAATISDALAKVEKLVGKNWDGYEVTLNVERTTWTNKTCQRGWKVIASVEGN